MSFRGYWNWKHTALVLFFIANTLFTNAAAPLAELVAAVVIVPLVVVGGIYGYWSARVKDGADATSA